MSETRQGDNTAAEVDEFGYSLRVWSTQRRGDPRLGDEVFVALRSQKETGRAKVTREKIEDPGHEYHGRIQVEFQDGSGYYHARPSKLTPILYQPHGKTVIVVSETDDFRALCRTQLQPGDRAVDIGSSTGYATNIMATYCRGDVLGLEIAQEMVERAQTKYPDLEFMHLNVVEERDKLRAACEGASKLFLDLGGNRPMESLVSLLPFIEKECSAQLIVVKNRELAGFAQRHICECRGAGSTQEGTATGHIPRPDEWWANVTHHVNEILAQRQKRSPSSYQVVNVEASELLRFTKYPLHYPPRETLPGGQLICRYYNYGICLNKDCSYDHITCHHCGREGHLAKVCCHDVAPSSSDRR